MFNFIHALVAKIVIFTTAIVVTITVPFHVSKPAITPIPTPIIHLSSSITAAPFQSPQSSSSSNLQPTVVEQPQPQITTITALVDCTGPDKKVIKLTQKVCDDFNAAWGNIPKPSPSPSSNDYNYQSIHNYVQSVQNQNSTNSNNSHSVNQGAQGLSPTVLPPASHPTPTPTPVSWPTWSGSCKGAPFSFTINFSSKEWQAPDGTLMDMGDNGRLRYSYSGGTMSLEINNSSGRIIYSNSSPDPAGTIIMGSSGTYTIKILGGSCGYYQFVDNSG